MTSVATAQPLTWVKSSTGTYPQVQTKAEGTSEIFVKGDLLIYDLSENGMVRVGHSSGVPTNPAVYGIALSDSTGTAGSPIDVLIPTLSDIFSATLGTSETVLEAPDQDNVGERAGLILMDTNNNSVWAVDSGTATHVSIVAIHPQDLARLGGAPGDATTPTMAAGDRVLFRFISAVLDDTNIQIA